MNQDEFKRRKKNLVDKLEINAQALKDQIQKQETYEDLSKASSQFLTENTEVFASSIDSKIFTEFLEEHYHLDKKVKRSFIQEREELLHEQRRLHQEEKEINEELKP